MEELTSLVRPASEALAEALRPMTLNKHANVAADFPRMLLFAVLFFYADVLLRNFLTVHLAKYFLSGTETKAKQEGAKAKSEGGKAAGKKPDGLKHRGKEEKSESLPKSESDSAEAKAQKLVLVREKFVTSCWKFFNYGFLLVVGFFVCTKEPYFFDGSLFFRGWPNQPMSDGIRFYYLVAMAHYIYASISIFWEPKQKDRSQMLLHHVITFFLLGLSYLGGFHRIGTITILLHDFTDPLMEVAKLCFYTNNKTGADISFGIFALAFIVLRLFVLPWHLIRNAMLVMYDIPYTGYCVLALLVLQVLHILWSTTIVKMVYMALVGGGVQGDDRDEE